MLKTNINNIAKPSKAFIILGILQGYLKHPILFFIKTIISFKRFKKTIEIELPEDFIKTNGLIAWIYINLQKEISKKQAFEVTRVILLSVGVIVQQANFRTVELDRNFENLINVQKRVKAEGTTKLNKMEIIEETENIYRYKVTHCMFFEFFKSINAPELTTIMCSIDNALFNSYLPEDIVFDREGINNKMPDGAEFCMFSLKKIQ